MSKNQIDKALALVKQAQFQSTTCTVCGRERLEFNVGLKETKLYDCKAPVVIAAVFAVCSECEEALDSIFLGDTSREFQHVMVKKALEYILPKVDKKKKEFAEIRQEMLDNAQKETKARMEKDAVDATLLTKAELEQEIKDLKEEKKNILDLEEEKAKRETGPKGA